MKKNNNLKNLVRSSIFTAISIILTRWFYIMITPELRIEFGALPIILTGLLLGPRFGALAGIAADIIGVLLNPMGGVIHLGFTFSSMLTGFIPGLIQFKLFKNNKTHMLKSIGISVFIIFLGVHLFLNTLWLSQLYGRSAIVLLPARFIKIAIVGSLTFLLLILIYKRIGKLIKD